MRFWAGVTDNDWYRFLSAEQGVDEVNFWQPSGRPPFKHLPSGSVFLFKLKAPHHQIAGGGLFVRFDRIPVRLAWEIFGRKNGVASLSAFEGKLDSLRTEAGASGEVGCSVLVEPFFWPRDQWIELGGDFASNIVTGKTFDTAEVAGARLWEQVQQRLALDTARVGAVQESTSGAVQFGAPVLHRPRLGQGAFRVLVTGAYDKTCAITGEHTLPVLEAAHIKPVAEGGAHDLRNGLLLRTDFHRLFDLGLVTVTPEYRIRVSRSIRDLWCNGAAYNRFEGRELRLPSAEADRPDRDLLAWHGTKVFEQRIA